MSFFIVFVTIHPRSYMNYFLDFMENLQVNGDKKYQIHLKSESGPIYVLLVNQEQEHTPPLVVQVSWLYEI